MLEPLTSRKFKKGGDVPELHFLNEGDISVLLLDREELVGAKQNRVLYLSILALTGL